MSWCKKDVIPLLTLYGYVYSALSHRIAITPWPQILSRYHIRLYPKYSQLTCWGHLNIKMLSYQYRVIKDQTISRPSDIYNGDLHTWKDGFNIETVHRAPTKHNKARTLCIILRTSQTVHWYKVTHMHFLRGWSQTSIIWNAPRKLIQLTQSSSLNNTEAIFLKYNSQCMGLENSLVCSIHVQYGIN